MALAVLTWHFSRDDLVWPLKSAPLASCSYRLCCWRCRVISAAFLIDLGTRIAVCFFGINYFSFPWEFTCKGSDSDRLCYKEH